MLAFIHILNELSKLFRHYMHRWQNVGITPLGADFTKAMLDNVVWSSSPGDGTGGEVCRLRLHFVVQRIQSCCHHLTEAFLGWKHKNTFFARTPKWIWRGRFEAEKGTESEEERAKLRGRGRGGTCTQRKNEKSAPAITPTIIYLRKRHRHSTCIYAVCIFDSFLL